MLSQIFSFFVHIVTSISLSSWSDSAALRFFFIWSGWRNIFMTAFVMHRNSKEGRGMRGVGGGVREGGKPNFSEHNSPPPSIMCCDPGAMMCFSDNFLAVESVKYYRKKAKKKKKIEKRRCAVEVSRNRKFSWAHLAPLPAWKWINFTKRCI